MLDHYERSPWSADVVALTGDLTQDETQGAYEHIARAFSDLGLPTLVVPGNHDVRGLMQEALRDAPFHYCTELRVGDWLLVGVDSCVSGAAHGAVSTAELDRMRGVIEDTTAEHVVVCLHHPPVLVGSRWLDEVGMKNREEFLAAVHDTGRVRLVLFGHVHQAVNDSDNGMPIIGTPSTCRQFKPKNDTFAVSDEPPAYRQVELLDDGTVHSDLIWVAD